MLPGQTFFWDFPGSHRWVIISDPEKDPHNVIIVSITTYEPGRDALCVISPMEGVLIPGP